MTPQEETFAWHVACKTAEMMSTGDENDIQPEDIKVTIETGADGVMEPTIGYEQGGYYWEATLRRVHSTRPHGTAY